MAKLIKHYFTCGWPERGLWTGLLLFAGLIVFGSFKFASGVYESLQVDPHCTEKVVYVGDTKFTLSAVSVAEHTYGYTLSCAEALKQHHRPWQLQGVSGQLYTAAVSILGAILLIGLVFWIMSYVIIVHDTLDEYFLNLHRECTNSMFRRLWLNFVGDVQFLVLGHSNLTEKDIGINRVWMH